MHKTILFVASDVFFKGGIERYARYELRALRELYGEKNVHAFSYHARGADSFEEEIFLAYSEENRGIFRKPFFVFQLLLFALRNPVDLVMINHVHLAPLGLILKLIAGIPYTVNVYGLEIWSGLSFLSRAALHHANAVIGDCQFIVSYCRTNIGISDERLNILYDCVDLERFKPQQPDNLLKHRHGIREDKFIILTIGRLDRIKGHEYVIRALKNLPPQIIYLIVGGGKLDGYLKQLTQSLGLSDRVFFTGRVDEKDLVGFYNLADVFVLLSRFDVNEGEGLPLTLIEAAACGKPIIVGNEDGSPEAVEPGHTGFVIPPLDIEALSDAINSLYAHAELRKSMGFAGQHKVDQEFSFPRFKQQLQSILQKT